MEKRLVATNSLLAGGSFIIGLRDIGTSARKALGKSQLILTCAALHNFLVKETGVGELLLEDVSDWSIRLH